MIPKIPRCTVDMLSQIINAKTLESSSPGEFHSQALTDPDVSLPAHPAPIVQPEVASPTSANVQIVVNHEELYVPTN